MISYAALARSVGPHARDLALIVLASSAIFCLDPIADAHASSAPLPVVTLPLLIATPGVLSFDVLLEDARFLLAVVICVWRIVRRGASRAWRLKKTPRRRHGLANSICRRSRPRGRVLCAPDRISTFRLNLEKIKIDYRTGYPHWRPYDTELEPWLPRVAYGRASGSDCGSRPSCGSGVSLLSSRARRRRKRYRRCRRRDSCQFSRDNSVRGRGSRPRPYHLRESRPRRAATGTGTSIGPSFGSGASRRASLSRHHRSRCRTCRRRGPD